MCIDTSINREEYEQKPERLNKTDEDSVVTRKNKTITHPKGLVKH